MRKGEKEGKGVRLAAAMEAVLAIRIGASTHRHELCGGTGSVKLGCRRWVAIWLDGALQYGLMK